MPKRLQLSRQRGWRKPVGAIVVARPGPFGNPFRVGARLSGLPLAGPGEIIDARMAVDLFRVTVVGEFRARVRRELRGRDLCCWCRVGQPCHADVLLEIANSDD